MSILGFLKKKKSFSNSEFIFENKRIGKGFTIRKKMLKKLDQDEQLSSFCFAPKLVGFTFGMALRN